MWRRNLPRKEGFMKARNMARRYRNKATDERAELNTIYTVMRMLKDQTKARRQRIHTYKLRAAVADAQATIDKIQETLNEIAG